MEVSSTRPRAIGRGRGRPAQALYMPPARRSRDPQVNDCDLIKSENTQDSCDQVTQNMDTAIETPHIVEQIPNLPQQKLVNLNITDNSITDITNKPSMPKSESSTNKQCKINDHHQNVQKEDKTPIQTSENKSPKSPEPQKAVIKVLGTENNKSTTHIINIEEKQKKDDVKVKTRSTKVIEPKCDVLPISLAKNIKKSPIKLVQVDQWEDLVNSDEEPSSPSRTVQKHKTVIPKYDEDDVEEYENLNNDQLEHIVEIYDFPSTFKTPDIMQIYNVMDQDSMYIKWLNETRALLVLGSAMQAKRAVGIENPFIKSRPVAMGSHMALEAVRTGNLRPAMKRPQTSMQAARRMITTALGAKSNVSREVQQRERDALRKAKEEKRNQRQSERDAWEGNPRPTTA